MTCQTIISSMLHQQSRSELLVDGVVPESLPDTEVGENLLRSSKDRVKLGGPRKELDEGAHARLGKTATAKEIDRLVGHVVGHACGPALKEGNLTGEMRGLLVVGHLVHLVRDVLEPGLGGFALGDESRELLPDDGLGDEGLAEGLALVCPHHQLGANGACGADRRAAHDPSLVVKVGQDDGNTSTLGTDEVASWDAAIVVGDVGGAGGGAVRRLDLLCLDASGCSRDADNDEALIFSVRVDELAGGGEVVCENPIGDPLLCAVDNVVGAVVCLLGRSAETTEDVGAGKGLCDSEADELLAGEDGLDNLPLEVVGAKVHDRGQANNHSSLQAITETPGAHADELLGDDELAEVVELLWIDVSEELAAQEVLSGTHSHGIDAELAHLLDELDVGTLSIGLAALSDLEDALIHVLAHLALETAMVVLVVRTVISILKPCGLSVGYLGGRTGRGGLVCRGGDAIAQV